MCRKKNSIKIIDDDGDEEAEEVCISIQVRGI